MRHMDVYMEQEEKYTEAVLSDTERLQSKLQSEMASRLAFDLSTPPLRWGPWYVSLTEYEILFGSREFGRKVVNFLDVIPAAGCTIVVSKKGSNIRCCVADWPA